MLRLVLINFILGFILPEASAQTQNLTFMFVTSFGQSGFNASGVVPAADIALEDINNSEDVLPGYNLVYDQVRDSQCHRGRSLDAFFDGIFSEPPRKLAVVGCGCSVATEPVAEISHQWNISQISYASSSPALSDRNKYKSFFRNTFNMQIMAPALRSAVAYFNWTRIAILTQNEGLFTGTESDIRNEFEKSCVNADSVSKEGCITVESRVFDTDGNPANAIEDLFNADKDYRVFFVNSFSEHARSIICYAQQRNYTYPRYAWIFYDWYPDNWWMSDGPVADCSNEDLSEFLNRVLTIQLPEFGNGSTTIGTTLMDFRNRYENRAREMGFNIINQAYKLYDVLWVLALALNSTVNMMNNREINGTGCEDYPGSLDIRLEEFDYSNKMIGCLIQWNIQRTDIYGLTGSVAFDENGTRIHTSVFFLQYQMQGGQLKKSTFAGVDRKQNFTFMFLPNFEISDIYPSGPPLDGRPIKIIHSFETWLTVLFYFLATLGIVFAIVCLLFNLIFRKRKTVRLSSPTLNYFIICGAISMYLSIFFYFLPTTRQNIIKARCVIEYWLFTVGYSLAFGAVFVKLWRVYQIFHNPQPNRKILTDWKLIAIVLAIAGLATLLLLFGEAVPYLRRVAVLVEDSEHLYGRNSFGIQEEYCVWVCQTSSSPSFYWQIFIFTYLIMLQVIALVLAIQTRKVKLRGLRDSKYVATIVYISSISIVVMALVIFSLGMYINIGTGILVTGIFALTTLFLVLIFVPKMILLYRDPYGKNLSMGQQSRSSAVAIPQLQDGVELGQRVTVLEKTVLEREKTIAELTHQIGILKKENDVVQNGNAKLDIVDHSDSSEMDVTHDSEREIETNNDG